MSKYSESAADINTINKSLSLKVRIWNEYDDQESWPWPSNFAETIQANKIDVVQVFLLNCYQKLIECLA